MSSQVSSFKSAAELGITEDERTKLIDVMHRLQEKQCSPFNMMMINLCIAGHSRIYPYPVGGYSNILETLFYPGIDTGDDERFWPAATDQKAAARAVERFLNGQPPWERQPKAPEDVVF